VASTDGAAVLCVGSTDGDGVGEVLDADGDGEAEALASADAEADAEAEGDAEGDGAADDALGSLLGVSSLVDGDGTLARTSSGSAPSRDGVSYENSPLANPAAPITTTTAPAALSSTPLRRPRGGRPPPPAPAVPGSVWGRGAVAEGSNRRRSRALGEPADGASGVGSAAVASVSPPAESALGGGGVGAVGASGCSPGASEAPDVPDAFGAFPVPSSSTYGRMRSGSKSSAAAAWAVRASRRASDALVPQAQDGVLSAALGVPHSGHEVPAGPSCGGSFR
jgi:hypothetical protein